MEVDLPEEVTSGAGSQRLKFIVYKTNQLFKVLSADANQTTQPTISWVVSAKIGQEKISGLTNPVVVKLPLTVQVSLFDHLSLSIYGHVLS